MKEKILNSVNQLGELLPEDNDIFEDLGIILDDLAQLYLSKDSRKFLIEKRDLMKQIKTFRRKIVNSTFKNIKHN